MQKLIMGKIPGEPVKVIELTDEEIWLRVYCAAMSCPLPEINPVDCADAALDRFHARFRQEE